MRTHSNHNNISLIGKLCLLRYNCCIRPIWHSDMEPSQWWRGGRLSYHHEAWLPTYVRQAVILCWYPTTPPPPPPARQTFSEWCVGLGWTCLYTALPACLWSARSATSQPASQPTVVRKSFVSDQSSVDLRSGVEHTTPQSTSQHSQQHCNVTTWPQPGLFVTCYSETTTG